MKNKTRYTDKEMNSRTTKDEEDNINDYNIDSFFVNKKILRIEYPGKIGNVENALETLGGISKLELVASNILRDIELRFHPNNKYNKPCVAVKDLNPGLLLQVKTTENSDNGLEIDYNVIGVTSLNYKFNSLCDFQYLPIVSAKDTSEGEAEMIYEKIYPKKLPSLDWFSSKEISNQTRFYCPQAFSRLAAPTNALYLNLNEKYNLFTNSIKSETTVNIDKGVGKKHVSITGLSIKLHIIDPNTKIPEKPSDVLLDVIKKKGLQESCNNVKKLFADRPIWTKPGIQFNLNLSCDCIKLVLPAVAYHCSLGPWRTCWIRYGYNPLRDFGSRTYQILDFRIRTSAGANVVAPKRNRMKYNTLSGVSKKNEERNFIIRPHVVPPARQMFYQYCDLHLPEIEEMLQRLPKIPANMKFDSKTGWLPTSFTEQCREIVNKYVLDAVGEELQRNRITTEEQSDNVDEVGEKSDDDAESEPITYCSKMLSDIKKGIYRSVNMLPFPERPSTSMIIDTVDLSEDVVQDTIDLDDAVNEIPETLSEASDDELSESSDLEIDLETAEEINKLIQKSKVNC